MSNPQNTLSPLRSTASTLAVINRLQTPTKRLRKLQGDMGEAIAAISRCLDDNRPGAHDPMLREIAQVALVTDSLFADSQLGPLLFQMQREEDARLRKRIDAGEFG